MEGILNHFSTIINKLIKVIVIEAVLIVIIVAAFLWYISLPVEEYSTEFDNGDVRSYDRSYDNSRDYSGNRGGYSGHDKEIDRFKMMMQDAVNQL